MLHAHLVRPWPAPLSARLLPVARTRLFRLRSRPDTSRHRPKAAPCPQQKLRRALVALLRISRRPSHPILSAEGRFSGRCPSSTSRHRRLWLPRWPARPPPLPAVARCQPHEEFRLCRQPVADQWHPRRLLQSCAQRPRLPLAPHVPWAVLRPPPRLFGPVPPQQPDPTAPLSIPVALLRLQSRQLQLRAASVGVSSSPPLPRSPLASTSRLGTRRSPASANSRWPRRWVIRARQRPPMGHPRP